MLVARAGLQGKWHEPNDHQHCFKSSEGGILNWWPSTSKINYQGNASGRQALVTAMQNLNPKASGQTPTMTSLQRRIFVVHGHDTEARDQLELMLHRLGLDPFILARRGAISWCRRRTTTAAGTTSRPSPCASIRRRWWRRSAPSSARPGKGSCGYVIYSTNHTASRISSSSKNIS